MNFDCPFSMLVVGPSGSGKSVFVNKLIQSRKELFSKHYKRVVWCYGIYQSFYDGLGYEMHKGLPNDNFLDVGNMILVVDDMMNEAQDLMSSIFTKISHHKNIACIFLTQNLFPKGNRSRDISLNAHYIVLMKNTRDKQQIWNLARQTHPHNPKFLADVYNDATLDPYSYLVIDFKQQTNEAHRLKTGILPGQRPYRYEPI